MSNYGMDLELKGEMDEVKTKVVEALKAQDLGYSPRSMFKNPEAKDRRRLQAILDPGCLQPTPGPQGAFYGRIDWPAPPAMLCSGSG
jgi:hypothetical protein